MKAGIHRSDQRGPARKGNNGGGLAKVEEKTGRDTGGIEYLDQLNAIGAENSGKKD